MADQSEQKYYNSIFTKTDLSGSGRIEGRQAVALFRTSGVPVQTLKSIWELATPNKEDFLDKNRFFVALRLIALAQEGKPVNVQMLHEKVGLPKFEGIELPQVPDEWEINDTELTVFTNGFKKLSGDKGFLTPAESKELLQRTAFAPDVLKKIWNLISLGNGNMNIDQFVVAMQIISKVRTGKEVPDVLPGSLDKIINKKAKEEAKKTEIRVKDPEPHIEVPKPVVQSTLGEEYESPKKQVSVVAKVDSERSIREKEKTLKEKTSILKNICELMEVDEGELDLVKEKNKILEEKIKESLDHFEKIKKKVAKAKEKFEKGLEDKLKKLETLQKENSELRSRPAEVKEVLVYKQAENTKSDVQFKNETPRVQETAPKHETLNKAPDRPSDEFKMPKKDIGFEFDNFFKDPFPTKPPEDQKPAQKEPKPFSEDPKPANLFPSHFEVKPEPKVEPFQSKVESKPEPPKNNLFPDFQMKFEGFSQPKPRNDDIFSNLDSAPSVPKKKNSSSDEEEVKPSAGFGFKFSEDLEKKNEKPVEAKPDAMGFGFGDFGKQFNFGGATAAFDNNFFKMEVKPVQNKGNSRDLEFDL